MTDSPRCRKTGDHRRERALPIPGDLDLHGARRVGQHRLGRLAIAGVAPVAALDRVTVVAQVLAHLLLERGLDDQLGHRLQQPARPRERHPRRPGLMNQLTGKLQLLILQRSRPGIHGPPGKQPADLGLDRRSLLDRIQIGRARR